MSMNGPEVKIACPHCSQRIGLPYHCAGVAIHCPTCDGVLTVPAVIGPTFDENASLSAPLNPPISANSSRDSDAETVSSLGSQPLLRLTLEFLFTVAMAYGVALVGSPQHEIISFLLLYISPVVCPLVLVFISSGSCRALLWCLLNSILITVFIYAMRSGENAAYDPVGMWTNLSTMPDGPVVYLKAQGAHWAMLAHFAISVAVAVVPKDLPTEPKPKPSGWSVIWDLLKGL